VGGAWAVLFCSVLLSSGWCVRDYVSIVGERDTYKHRSGSDPEKLRGGMSEGRYKERGWREGAD